jgi:hypothetical protein
MLGLREVLGLMLPDTFLLQATEEPFDDPVLLGRAGGNELLLQPIVPTGRAKPLTLKDQPVVTSDNQSCTVGGRPMRDGPLRSLNRHPSQSGAVNRLIPVCPHCGGRLLPRRHEH